MTRRIVGILLILLLGAAMRIENAGHFATWSDEGWNLWVVHDTTPETILNRLIQNHHPPAYFMSLAGWRALTGESRIALRFPSILAGLLCIALIYRIGTDNINRSAGLSAAALFAVFEQAVYYGQSVRHYGFLALGVCLMIWTFLRLLKKPERRWAIAYAFSTAFTLYSMYLGVFVLALQGFVGLFLWQVPIRKKYPLFAAWIGAGLLLLPWFLYALPHQINKVQRGIITGYHNTFTTTPHNLIVMSDLLLGGQFALGAALIMLALWHLLQNRNLSRGFLAFASAGMFVMLLAVNLFIGILAERTLYFLVPATVLMMGYGLSLVQTRFRRLLLASIGLWMIVTSQGIIPHMNTDVVAQTIRDQYNVGDFVLLETGFDDVAFEQELKLTLPATDQKIFRSYYEYDYTSDQQMMDTLNAELDDEQRVWVVYWNIPPRFADHLATLGFTRQQFYEIPVGENDPLYKQYPVISISLFTRPMVGAEPLIYGDLLALQDALITPEARAGENLQVDLWWSPVEDVTRDYSIGVFLLDPSGVTKVEHIGPATPTSTWQVGQTVYDRHTLALPPDLPAGEYQVIANVYWWETVEPLPVNGEPYAHIGTVTLK